MNLSFYFGILVFYGASTHPVRKIATPAEVADANEYRRLMAEASGIKVPNLVWDEQLVRKAAAINDSSLICPTLSHGLNYRAFADAPDENGVKLNKFLVALFAHGAGVKSYPKGLNATEKEAYDQLAKYMQTQINKGHLYHFELLNPAQTKIGCAPKKCMEFLWSPEETFKKLDMGDGVYVFKTVCMIGPSPSWDHSTFKKVAALKLDDPFLN